MREAAGVERFADHAGGCQEHLAGRAAGRLRTCLAGQHSCFAALFPGEGVGVARIDDQQPRASAGKVLAAEIDWRRRAFRPREDAGNLCPLIEDHGQNIGPVLVLYTGLGGRHADPVDRRHFRVFLRRQRRNGCGHGTSGLKYRENEVRLPDSAKPRKTFSGPACGSDESPLFWGPKADTGRNESALGWPELG